MNCTGQPVNKAMADYIEFTNLYVNFNRAWFEMYLNMYQWYLPYFKKGN